MERLHVSNTSKQVPKRLNITDKQAAKQIRLADSSRPHSTMTIDAVGGGGPDCAYSRVQS